MSEAPPPHIRRDILSRLEHLLTAPGYRVISLSGDAGVGKSHLIREALQGIAHISGKFDTGKDTTLAYAAFVQAIRNTLTRLLSLPEAEFSTWQNQLQREVPFGPLLGVLPELRYFQPAEARLAGAKLFSDTLSLARPFERAFLKLWQCLTGSTQPGSLRLIWLDDVQWMDTASAAFLEFLLQQDLPVHWVLSGRDTRGVGELMQRLKIEHTRLALEPFSARETLSFVQSRLNSPAEDCRELAAFLHSLSQGFPLELAWGLKELLHAQKIVNQQGWQYTGRLAELGGSAYKGWGELMSQQWQRLPETVQSLLRLASLLGPNFSRDDLRQVLQASDEAFETAWEAAQASGFLTPGQGDEGCFAHDRLYEWVQQSWDPEPRAGGHLAIARHLLARAGDKLELTVEQLNACRELLEPHERQIRLEKNLALVRNMLSQGAIGQARQLLLQLEQDIPEQNPLWPGYRLLLASQAYLANQMPEAEAILLALTRTASGDLLLDAQLLLIVIYTQHNRYAETVRFGMDLLEQLGLHIDTDPEHIARMFERSYAAVQRASVQELVALAEAASSPAFEARMKVLATVAVAIYNFDLQLYGITVLHALDMILQGQGTSRATILYSAASLLLLNQSGELAPALGLIRAAEQLARQHGRDDDLTMIHCVKGNFITPWHKSFRAAREYLASSWEAGQRSGNLQFAGYTGVFRGANLFMSAHPLPEFADKILPELIAFNRRIENYSPLDGSTAYAFLIHKLRQDAFWTPERSEETFIADLRRRESNADLSRYFTYKAFVLLLFGDAAGAWEALQQSQLDIYLPASIDRAWYLLLADILPWRLGLGPERRSERPAVLPFTLAQLAALNPANFAVLHAVWQAEQPQQEALERLRAWHRAVLAARGQELWHWEGYALERIAALQQEQGLELLAQQSLLESVQAFQRWGATAKVEQLVARLTPDYAARWRAANQTLSRDLAEILQICAEFSRILEPAALQRRILEVLKSHARAERIELLLHGEGGQWQCFTLDAQTPEGLRESVPDVPRLLLDFVARTRQSVMLPAHNELFNSYEIQHLQGQHLLLPLVLQQTLTGIVYLQPTAGTRFFDLRAELLLQALGGYLAGALHNARRAQNLENLISLHTQDLKSANQRLSQLLEERQEVLSIVAHDLKHPLGTLKLGISMLEQMEDELTAEMRSKAFQNLGQTLEDMNHNTERLLMIEQLETRILRPHWKQVGLQATLQPFLKNYEWKAGEKNQQLIFSGFHHDALIETDPSLLKILLNNLLENAIKFSPIGATIQVELQIEAEGFSLTIRDQGPGFTQEDQQRLFRKFGRLSARPTAGESSHGLGLFIVRRLVEDLGGQLELSSAPGQGSSFCVRFGSKS